MEKKYQYENETCFKTKVISRNLNEMLKKMKLIKKPE